MQVANDAPWDVAWIHLPHMLNCGLLVLAKIENEIEIKSYQQDWKNLPHHLSYRQDENSLQQLVSHLI